MSNPHDLGNSQDFTDLKKRVEILEKKSEKVIKKNTQ